MTARPNLHVLVSGAGVAGNALAVLLGRAGIRVSMIEKTASCLSQGHNIDVDGLAVEIFRHELKLLDQLRKCNTTEAGTSFHTSSGRTLASFPVTAKDGTVRDGPTSEYEVLRGDLSNLLYDGARGHGSVAYYLGRSIAEVVSTDPSTGVSVVLDDGTKLQGDLLVLADGQWSKLRSSLFTKPDAVGYRPMDMYIAFFTLAEQKHDDRFWRVNFTTERRAMSIRPDPHGTMRGMLAVMPRSASERSMLQELRKKTPAEQRGVFSSIFANAGWESDRLLRGMADASDFYYQCITQVQMPTWRLTSSNGAQEGNVVCLGDAAYCPTPLSGMGASLAIDGAYYLAGELTRYRDGAHASVAQACDAYQAKMKPHVDKHQPFSPWLIYRRSALGVALVNAVFWLAGRVAATGVLTWWAGEKGKQFDAKPLPEDYDFTPFDAAKAQKAERKHAA